MELFRLRFAAVAFVGLGGLASAQTDSTGLRKDSLATPAFVLAAVPDSSTTTPMPVDSGTKDSLVAAVAVVLPVAKLDSVVVPTVVAPAKGKRCGHCMTWAVEGSVRYGWRLGELIDEEDRLTRRFKVVLTDNKKDTSEVNPIASGFVYQAALWAKIPHGNQVGLGFQYGRFVEHPASSYNLSLSENLWEQYLVTARYRYCLPLGSSFRVFGEAAAGWNHSTLHRVALVAAHLDDTVLHFSASQYALVNALHASTETDGLHAELGIGAQYLFARSWSVGFTVNPSLDRIWISPNAGESDAAYDQSPNFWGTDIGLSVTHEF